MHFLQSNLKGYILSSDAGLGIEEMGNLTFSCDSFWLKMIILMHSKETEV